MDDFIQAMKLFNEQVARLKEHPIITRLDSGDFPRHNAFIEYVANVEDDEEWDLFYKDRSIVELESLILRLRFFNQDTERSSTRNLARLYNKSKLIPKKTRNEFNFVRQQLNNLLDENRIEIENQFFSGRTIIDVLFYSKYAHTNKFSPTLKSWEKQMPGILPILEVHFLEIVKAWFGFLEILSHINEKTIECLEQKIRSPDQRGDH